jgi:hypothetical protein
VLTGRRLFPGETAVEILGAVLNRDPDISAAPPRVHKLLRWCLEKDRKQRLASISDARRLLEESPAPATIAEPAPSRSWLSSAGWIEAGLATIAATMLAFLYFRTTPPAEQSLAKLSVLPPPNVSLPSEYPPIISPDGRKLAFIGRDASGKTMLWVRQFDSLTAQPLAGTEDARNPFWASDSSSIAFLNQGKLKRVDLAGGAPRSCVKHLLPTRAERGVPRE